MLMPRRRLVCVAVGVLAVIGVLAACQSPTQIILHIRTNVQCEREAPFPVVSVGRIDRPDDDAPLASTHVDCSTGGDLGTLVLTPTSADDRNAAVGLRVALRYAKDRDPDHGTGDCTRASAAFCIVQRRIVEFRAHETIDLPIQLDVSCKGVYCSALETCNHASQCVSAECTDGTCDAVNRSGDPGMDGGGPDGSTPGDGAADGTNDAAAPDGDSASLTDGGVVSDAAVECRRGAQPLTCAGLARLCCVDAGGASCTAASTCPQAGNSYECDEKSDCAGGLYCVNTHPSGGSNYTQCRGAPAFNPYQEVACRTNADCPNSASCTPSGSTTPPWGTCPNPPP